ncbi:MAG: hypothetical protein JNK73_02080 [Bacteroidia bacterium]|nr:hypothetical protein [Bacteroidia bacterium]
MIKKMKTLAVVCSALLIASSCSVTHPLMAPTTNTVGKKVGEAKAKWVLGLCFGADHSVLTAAKNGGITKIATIDEKTFAVYPFFWSKKTIVSGE